MEQTTQNVATHSPRELRRDSNNEYNLFGLGTVEVHSHKRRRRHRGRGGKGQKARDDSVSDTATDHDSVSTSSHPPEHSPSPDTQHNDNQSSISIPSQSSSEPSQVFSSNGSSTSSDTTSASESSRPHNSPLQSCDGEDEHSVSAEARQHVSNSTSRVSLHGSTSQSSESIRVPTFHASDPHPELNGTEDKRISGVGTRTPTQETYNHNNLYPGRPSLNPMGSDHPASASQDSLASIYSQVSIAETNSSLDYNEDRLDEQFEDMLGMIEVIADDTVTMENDNDINFVRFNLSRIGNGMLQHQILFRSYCVHRDKRIRHLERELSHTESSHQQSEATNRDLVDELSHITVLLRHMDKRAADAEAGAERYERQIGKLSQEHRIIKDDLTAARVELSELRRYQEMPKLLDSAHEEVKMAQSVNIGLRQQIHHKNTEIDDLSRQITTIQLDNSLLREHYQQTASGLNTAREIISIAERSSANSLPYRESRESREATSLPNAPISTTSTINNERALETIVERQPPAGVEEKAAARPPATIGPANLAGALRWVVTSFSATTDGRVWDMKFPEYASRGTQAVNSVREVKEETTVPVTSLSLNDGHIVTAVEEESEDDETAVTPSTSPTASESEVTDADAEDTIVVTPDPLSVFGQAWEADDESIVLSASVPPYGGLVWLLWTIVKGVYWPVLLFMFLQVWDARKMWLDANSNEDRNEAIRHARNYYRIGHPFLEHWLLVLIDKLGVTREVFEE
jgi:hypothetical protein